MRVKYDWRSSSKENYKDFCNKNPSDNISYTDWKKIIYSFNNLFCDHILDTGEKGRLPSGLGEFVINKKKRKKVNIVDGKEYIKLPIDWVKTKEKGKYIYNFNYHTEGYFFGWKWMPDSARFKYSDLWYFRVCREKSRKLGSLLINDPQRQHIYATWIIRIKNVKLL
jgi:hypothetical protein